MKPLVISVGIVAFNEEKCIGELLGLLLEQDYQKSNTELLLINSMSTDSTKDIFIEFKEENESADKSIKIIDNKGKIQASGWNEAIRNFSGEALIRLDAHARIEKDFI